MISSSDKSYSDVLYKIGMVYQAIGDIEYLVKDIREDSYITAVAYLELSTKANGYYSNYYSGMLNHKLIIIRKNNPDSYLYITGAEKYYRKCLSCVSSHGSAQNLKRFLIDVYNYSIEYNAIFGQKKKMHSTKEYKTLISSWEEQIS